MTANLSVSRRFWKQRACEALGAEVVRMTVGPELFYGPASAGSHRLLQCLALCTGSNHWRRDIGI